LYGVTMQEQGVSKIVSVRFNREEGAPESKTETPNRLESAPAENTEATRSLPPSDAVTLQNGRHSESQASTPESTEAVAVNAQPVESDSAVVPPASPTASTGPDDDQQVIMAK